MPDKNGMTPVHMAAAFGRVEVLELLFARGGDTNPQDDSGETPLHLAAGYAHRDAVEYLLAHGADPTIQTIHGDTVLDMAARPERGGERIFIISDGSSGRSTLPVTSATHTSASGDAEENDIVRLLKNADATETVKSAP